MGFKVVLKAPLKKKEESPNNLETNKQLFKKEDNKDERKC